MVDTLLLITAIQHEYKHGTVTAKWP